MANPTRTLYLVAEGDVTEAPADAQHDGIESIVVLAYTPELALLLAKQYDQGRIQADNHIVDGRTVVCVASHVA